MDKTDKWILAIFSMFLIVIAVILFSSPKTETNENESGEMEVFGTEYVLGDYATIFLQLKDAQGLPVSNGNCYLDIYYPAEVHPSHPVYGENIGMLYKDGSKGIYYYDLMIPANITGVYMLTAQCSYAYDVNWVYSPEDNVEKPNRTVVAGTFIGDTLALNSFEDTVYTRCDSTGGGTKICEAYYDFNVSRIINLTAVDVYYSGETTSSATATFHVWNWTSSSWITLPNNLTFYGTATSAGVSSIDEFMTNQVPINDTINGGGIMRIRMYVASGNRFSLYSNWLSLKFLTQYGSTQDLKGSGEMHVSNLNQTFSTGAEVIWTYHNRTLTNFTALWEYMLGIWNTSNPAQDPNVIIVT